MENNNEIIQQPKKKYGWKYFGFFILGTVFGIIVSITVSTLFIYSGIKGIADAFEEEASKSTINENQESGLYSISGKTRAGNKQSYTFRKIDNNSEMFTLSTSEYEWINGLYSYRDYINFNFIFNNGEIVAWKVVDKNTNKNLGDPQKIDWISVIGNGNVTKVSEHLNGNKFSIDSGKLIYNDTQKEKTLKIIDNWDEEKAPVKLKSGEYYINDDMWEIKVLIKE